MFIDKLVMSTAILRPALGRRYFSTSLSRRSDALFVVGNSPDTHNQLLKPSY